MNRVNWEENEVRPKRRKSEMARRMEESYVAKLYAEKEDKKIDNERIIFHW